MAIQPPNAWLIQRLNPDGTVAAAAQTLASLNIDSATFDLNNMAADVLTFTVGGLAFDAAQLWPYGTLMALLKPNGTRFFFGRIEPWRRDGMPGKQNHTGRLVNPWWYLVNKIYQQRYTIAQFAEIGGAGEQPQAPTYITYTTPRVVLNVLWNPPAGFNPAPGAPPIAVNQPAGFFSATTGQQIEDALEWAILQGAPITIGEIDPATMPFSDYQKGITCAAVIQKMFRIEPDFAMDWDYTTLPFPTVHFRKNASLVPITIDLTDIELQDQVKISERPDWQKSYVNINYDQTDTQGGQQFLEIFNDFYPNPIPAGVEASFRGVDLFCDLTGSSVSSTSQTANFASLFYDINSVQQWQRWKPDLDPSIHPEIVLVQLSGINIETQDEYAGNGGPVSFDSLCAYEIIDGAWAAWIPNTISQRVRVTGTAVVTKNKGAAGLVNENIAINHDLTVVNLGTGGISQNFTQTNATITTYAEPIPLNLAQAMWTCWQNLALEGNFQNVEAVIGSDQVISRANCLNFLTGPGVNWTAVNASIQRISGDIAKGITDVQFGAPLHLTGHELIDAIRATRFRVTTIDLNYLFGGALPGSGASNVALARKTHARHAQAGTPHHQQLVVSGNPAPASTDPYVAHDGGGGTTAWQPPNGPASPTIFIDPSKAKGSDGNWHFLTLQEVKVCVSIGGTLKQRTAIALISDIYQGNGDPA